eukprot:8905454-Pyramimonas_sp.AAC.3
MDQSDAGSAGIFSRTCTAVLFLLYPAPPAGVERTHEWTTGFLAAYLVSYTAAVLLQYCYCAYLPKPESTTGFLPPGFSSSSSSPEPSSSCFSSWPYLRLSVLAVLEFTCRSTEAQCLSCYRIVVQ